MTRAGHIAIRATLTFITTVAVGADVVAYDNVHHVIIDVEWWAVLALLFWAVAIGSLLVLAGTGVLYMNGWGRERVPVRQKSPGICPDCGYDLRATPARCPECGLVKAGETLSLETPEQREYGGHFGRRDAVSRMWGDERR